LKADRYRWSQHNIHFVVVVVAVCVVDYVVGTPVAIDVVVSIVIVAKDSGKCGCCRCCCFLAKL
jgi:hypothetical protein